jgi:hypothetical protein
MLPAKIFQMRKVLLKLSLANQRQKPEVILKTFEVFTYGDIHFITN